MEPSTGYSKAGFPDYAGSERPSGWMRPGVLGEKKAEDADTTCTKQTGPESQEELTNGVTSQLPVWAL